MKRILIYRGMQLATAIRECLGPPWTICPFFAAADVSTDTNIKLYCAFFHTEHRQLRCLCLNSRHPSYRTKPGSDQTNESCKWSFEHWRLCTVACPMQKSNVWILNSLDCWEMLIETASVPLHWCSDVRIPLSGTHYMPVTRWALMPPFVVCALPSHPYYLCGNCYR